MIRWPLGILAVALLAGATVRGGRSTDGRGLVHFSAREPLSREDDGRKHGPVPFDLAAAIQAAQPGATIEVPPGSYPGPLVIRKPVVLLGRPGAVIDGGGRGDVVQIVSPGVTLRGFAIRHSGTSLDEENSGIVVAAPQATIEDNVLEEVLFGIYLKSSRASVVRGNRVAGMSLDIARRGDGLRLWYSDGCRLENNTIADTRDAVVWFSRTVEICNNTVTRSRYGLHFMYSADNTIIGNRLEGNSVGIYLMYSQNAILRGNTFAENRGPSGYGIGLKDMDGLVAEDNQCVGNRVGVYLDNSPQSIDAHGHFTRNVLAFNDVGIAFQPSVQRNIFRDNAFLENLEQVAILGSGTFEGNSFTVDGRGNFWSDYAGYDLAGDGIGDLPYQPSKLFENLMDRQPKLRLLLFSPAEQAVEMAARAFPLLRPEPKLTDTHPLMRPAPVALSASAASPSRVPMASVAIALLAAACAAAAAVTGRRRLRWLPIVTSTPWKGESQPMVQPALRFQPPLDLSGGEMIVVSGLTKRFSRLVAVDALSFRVARGEALALWGLNGAGKTTVIKCLLGLIHSQGRIVVAGHDLRRDGKAVRQAIGYVPQEAGFHADLATRDALGFYARLKGVPAARVEQVLDEVGLTDHAHKPVAALSGGMRRRLALASALLADPPLLVLDEATANLDTEARDALLALVEDQKRRGKAILFTSHRLDEVERLADRVLAMRAGRLVFDGDPREWAERQRATRQSEFKTPEQEFAHDRL